MSLMTVMKCSENSKSIKDATDDVTQLAKFEPQTIKKASWLLYQNASRPLCIQLCVANVTDSYHCGQMWAAKVIECNALRGGEISL